jgi:hypothetical protein
MTWPFFLLVFALSVPFRVTAALTDLQLLPGLSVGVPHEATRRTAGAAAGVYCSDYFNRYVPTGLQLACPPDAMVSIESPAAWAQRDC